MENKVIIIAGATGSGKSALALKLAQEQAQGSVIINADSMQVYQDLALLTARPSREDMDKVPHRLYGFLSGKERFSAAAWAAMAAEEIKAAFAKGLVPIVVGGTGLYISALVDGLAPVPDVPLEIRQKVRAMDIDEARVRLHEVDKDFAFTDKHRVFRALEVYLATGRTHTSWQQEPRQKLVDAVFEKRYLEPDRVELYEHLNQRFLDMLKAGAVDEVRALLAKKYPDDAPVMKALGVSEIKQFLHGELSKEDMILRAQQSTRNYAKRQITWFRHQF